MAGISDSYFRVGDPFSPQNKACAAELKVGRGAQEDAQDIEIGSRSSGQVMSRAVAAGAQDPQREAQVRGMIDCVIDKFAAVGKVDRGIAPVLQDMYSDAKEWGQFTRAMGNEQLNQWRGR